MNIKAAIFDMDGTLVNSLICWDVLWSYFGEKYLNDKSFRPREEDDKTVRTLTSADAMELIHNRYGIGSSGKELQEIFQRFLRDFYANRVELKKGVREFLDVCKNRGVKMCIASATDPELLDIAIKRCGLEGYFSNVFSCGSIGKGKDEPDIFLQACEFLGTYVEETWVFEDSLVAIKTAASIGMPTVAIYDACNYGQEEMKKIAKKYIDDGGSLMQLVKPMKIQPAIVYNPKDITGQEWIDAAVEDGFKCMEIAVHMLDGEEDEIIEYAKRKGLSVSLHSNYGRNNITDTDKENRLKSIAQHKHSIDLAAKHNLQGVTFHPGRLSDESESVEEKWEMLLEIVADIAAYAKEKKVRVGLENMERRRFEFVHTIDDLNRLAEIAKDNPYFGVTIDFAHFSSLNITKPDLSQLKLKVHDVHLSQATEDKMHTPLTVENGKVDLESVCEILDEYNYSGFVVLETRKQYAESKKVLEDTMAKVLEK